MNDELLKLTIEQSMGLTLQPGQFEKIRERIDKLMQQGLDQSDAITTALEMELPADKSELNLSQD
jgi:uncharacterized protein YoaH (UPF0181 family)